jgi:exopolysaccharide biosynthesis polyprenyl glycosylphosphotransferase
VPVPGRPDARRLVSVRDGTYRRALALADALAGACALGLTRLLGGGTRPATLVVVPAIVLISKLLGIYDREELLVRKSTLDEAPVVFQLATLYSLVVWLINGQFITGTTDRRGLLSLWLSTFLLLLLFRATARMISRAITPVERCLVIGDGQTCQRLRTKLARRRSLHAQVVANVPVDGFGREPPGLGTYLERQDLTALISQYRIDRILLAPERADAEEVLNMIRVATMLGTKVSVLPRILEVVGSSVEFDEVEGVPLLSVRTPYLSRSSQLIKRSLDLTVSVLGLIASAPLIALIALAIKLDARGPVLFRQLRIGRDDRPFEMLKFRTMVVGADEQRDQLRHLNEADGLFKIAQDPRITRVGGVLRQLSLDELPQLWNVVRGDMSLVGPRPLVIEEDSRIEGWHRRRLQLTPGMTGHWQILGPARIPLDEMVKIDYLYVTNWSLWEDMKILLRTIPYVVARRGM